MGAPRAYLRLGLSACGLFHWSVLAFVLPGGCRSPVQPPRRGNPYLLLRAGKETGLFDKDRLLDAVDSIAPGSTDLQDVMDMALDMVHSTMKLQKPAVLEQMPTIEAQLQLMEPAGDPHTAAQDSSGGSDAPQDSTETPIGEAEPHDSDLDSDGMQLMQEAAALARLKQDLVLAAMRGDVAAMLSACAAVPPRARARRRRRAPHPSPRRRRRRPHGRARSTAAAAAVKAAGRGAGGGGAGRVGEGAPRGRCGGGARRRRQRRRCVCARIVRYAHRRHGRGRRAGVQRSARRRG
ncbi:hypothetical protein JKP88DRAFT_251125 [Tribonema minus]|uniref:Uncharacterized protein n=1 Tax=Tribonema minus TaxID=303371 RepID=A0A835ZCU9_9STRA|nr:hypothetical protein JKP88DRAFT_251125 [Tribonema minus]